MHDRRAATFGAGFLLALSGVWVFGLVLATDDDARVLAISAIGMELFLLGIALGGASVSRATPRVRLGLTPGRLSGTSIAILAVGTIALSHGIDGILQTTGLRDHGVIAEINDRLRGVRGTSLLLAILGIGIAPGFAEEILCRGWIQRGLETRIGAPAAILVATFVFGALHGDPVHSAAATGLGLYLGIVAWLAGSIRASIVCHTTNNLAAVLSLAFEVPTGLPSIWTLSAALGSAMLCLAWVWRRAGAPVSRAPDPLAAPRP